MSAQSRSAASRVTPRARAAASRRARIAEAALAEFAEKGFAAARVEDIAARAGVAKGTVYLHFADKHGLFAGIVEQAIAPLVDDLVGREPEPGESVRAFLLRTLPALATRLGEAPRADVIRLLLAEGPRFPGLAASYYNAVVARGLDRLAELARRAEREGEAGGAVLGRFPLLVIAPAVMGVIWSGLFAGHQELDVPGFVRAQVELLFPPEVAAPKA